MARPVKKKPERKPGRKADYNGATPKQVARFMLMKGRAKPVKTAKKGEA